LPSSRFRTRGAGIAIEAVASGASPPGRAIPDRGDERRDVFLGGGVNASSQYGVLR
jgi:hypothetical protein